MPTKAMACNFIATEWVVLASDYDALAARLADREAECSRASIRCARMQAERDEARRECERLTGLLDRRAADSAPLVADRDGTRIQWSHEQTPSPCPPADGLPQTAYCAAETAPAKPKAYTCYHHNYSQDPVSLRSTCLDCGATTDKTIGGLVGIRAAETANSQSADARISNQPDVPKMGTAWSNIGRVDSFTIPVDVPPEGIGSRVAPYKLGAAETAPASYGPYKFEDCRIDPVPPPGFNDDVVMAQMLINGFARAYCSKCEAALRVEPMGTRAVKIHSCPQCKPAVTVNEGL